MIKITNQKTLERGINHPRFNGKLYLAPNPKGALFELGENIKNSIIVAVPAGALESNLSNFV